MLWHHGFGGLAEFQRWHGFAPTGRLNHSTVRCLNAVRCSHPERARAASAEQSAMAAMVTAPVCLSTAAEAKAPQYHDRIAAPGHPYEVIGARWSTKALRFALVGSPPAYLGKSAFDAVRRAFATWTSATGFELTEERRPERAEIRVLWTPGRAGDPDSPDPFYGPGDKVAVGWYPYPFSGGLAGDLHLDTAEQWATDPAQGLDVETVALHEIGHCLGIGHSRMPDSIMYPTYAREKRVLDAADVAEVARHYEGVS